MLTMLILGTWIFLIVFIWFIVYGASLYDRRSKTTARHRWDAPKTLVDELERILDEAEKKILVGE